MGAALSGFASSEINEVNALTAAGLDNMPESCLSSILGYLDPPEICKLAKVNQAFHHASSADFVWESKLPSNYKYLLEEVLGQSLERRTKKDIYAKLCKLNSFDGGAKQFWLVKSSGKVCVAISSKAMKITGIDDRRYWNHIPTEESRFHTIAYLQQIWWVEVQGELEFQFPPGTYSLFFRLRLGKSSRRFGRRVCNLEQVHGWDIKPVRFQLSTSDGQQAISQCYLHEPGSWVYYHVGDFVVENSNKPLKIKFSMNQIDCTHTKGGLCLDSVFIYPSDYKKELE